MVVISPTRAESDGQTHRFVWSGLSEGDTAQSIRIPGVDDRAVQVFGTFGGATVTVEGSIQDQATVFATLKDKHGNLLSFTDAGLEQIAGLVTHIRPAITGGTGAEVTVVFLARKNI